MRYAVVYSDEPVTIAQYLPGNYAVSTVTAGRVMVAGEDNAGWTLDDYVIPRLGSGLIRCEELLMTSMGLLTRAEINDYRSAGDPVRMTDG